MEESLEVQWGATRGGLRSEVKRKRNSSSLSLIPTSSTDWEDIGLSVSIACPRGIVGIGVVS